MEEGKLTGNRAVVYKGAGRVAVEDIGYPDLILRDGPGVNPLNIGRKCEHGVILKVVTTNICGSDQHMVRGRTTAPEGLVLRFTVSQPKLLACASRSLFKSPTITTEAPRSCAE